MPDPRDLLPPLPGEPSKIEYMEGLIDVLSHIFDMTTTEVSRKLLDDDIRSWVDFKARVWEAAKAIGLL